jgi:hypothetical protein
VWCDRVGSRSCDDRVASYSVARDNGGSGKSGRGRPAAPPRP